MKLPSKPLVAIAVSAMLALPSVATAGGDITSVNKSIRIDASESVGDVESVNGSIRVGDSAVVTSITSVNGSIDIGEDAQIEDNIEAVNGAVEMARGSEAGGSIETVNGTIKLYEANVGGHVQSYNGGIRLLDGTVIGGDVVVRKPKGYSSSKRKPVKVEIGENVKVLGDLIFEHPVELRLHDSAKVGEVIGEDIKRIDS